MAAAGSPRRLRRAGNFPETPEWNFVFINHVTTNPFFVPTHLRHRGRLGAARHDVPVDRLGDLRHPRDGQRLRSGDRRRGRRHRRRDSSTSRRSTIRSKQALDAGIPVVVVQRRRPERPDGVRRPGSVRVGRGDGRAHRRARRRGQGRVVHRHAGPAEHPAAHRRRDPGHRGVRRQHRVRAGRDERRAPRGAQPHRGLVPRQHRRRRHVRRRRRQHAGGRPGGAAAECPRQRPQGRRRVRPAADDRAARRRRRARLHDRSAAVPAGLPAGAVPVPLEVVGWRRAAARDEHRPRVPQLGDGGAVPRDVEPVRGRLGRSSRSSSLPAEPHDDATPSRARRTTAKRPSGRRPPSRRRRPRRCRVPPT